MEYPYEALREAIINTLIHRNYLGASSINTASNDLRQLVENHILKESGVKGAGSYYNIA